MIGVFLGDQQTAAVVRGKISKKKTCGGGKMIEKMKMVYVVSSVSKKDEMLDGLRDLGLLHLAEKKVRHAQRQKDLQHFLRLPEYY